MAVFCQGLAREDLKRIGLRGRFFGTMRRREPMFPRPTFAEFGPPAMAPTATTPAVKGPAVIEFLGGWGSGDRNRGRYRHGRRLGGGRRCRWRHLGRSNFGGGWQGLRYHGSSRCGRRCCLLCRELGSTRFRFLEDLVIFFLVLVEVGNVKEGITIEADIHKRRLHAGEHAANPPLIDTAYQANVGIAFEIHLDQLVVFQHGHLRLVRRRGNIHLLRHGNSFFRNAGESIRLPTEISQQRSLPVGHHQAMDGSGLDRINIDSG